MYTALKLYLAAAFVVAVGALLYRTVLPDSPEKAFFASLLAGIIATGTLTLLGHDPF